MSDRRTYRLEIIFLAAVAAILVYQLIIPPIVGLANAGDFQRLMNWFGLRFTSSEDFDINFLFVNREFAWTHRFGISYPSSELVFLGAALLLDAPFHWNSFDIRFIGAVHTLSLLAILALLVQFTKALSFGQRCLAYTLITFMFTSVGYAAYFNTMYSEPASMLFLAAVIAFALLAASNEQPERRKLLLVGFVVAAGLFTTAKVQNVFTGLPLAVVAYRLCNTVEEEGKRRYARFARVSVVVLVAISVVYYSVYALAPGRIRMCNTYNSIFTGILPYSPSPGRDADELGVDRRFVKYAGTHAFLAHVIPIRAQAVQHTSHTKILAFYIKHPGRLMNLAQRAASHAFDMRPRDRGNFEKECVMQALAARSTSLTVNPYSQPDEFRSNSFAYWDRIKQSAMPKSLWFVLLFLAFNTTAVVVKRICLDDSRCARISSEMHAALVAMAVIQFLSVIVAEGTSDIVKHLFLFNLLCDICLIFLVMYIAGGIAARRRPKSKLAAGIV